MVAVPLTSPTSAGDRVVAGRPIVAAGFLPRDRVARRLAQLLVGLVGYGVSIALMVRADLGLEPWGVFHQGVSRLSGLTMGVVSIIAGAVVLLGWIPLRQRPGLGTLCNVVLIGVALDATLAVVPVVHSLVLRACLLAVGVVGNGIATGAYIGAGLGPGPRDGLMTGWSRRTGLPLRTVRTAIELTVLITGIILGGTVGIGTVVYAVAIGPLAQAFLGPLAVRPKG